MPSCLIVSYFVTIVGIFLPISIFLGNNDRPRKTPAIKIRIISKLDDNFTVFPNCVKNST